MTRPIGNQAIGHFVKDARPASAHHAGVAEFVMARCEARSLERAKTDYAVGKE